jgi:hypothetical protein
MGSLAVGGSVAVAGDNRGSVGVLCGAQAARAAEHVPAGGRCGGAGHRQPPGGTTRRVPYRTTTYEAARDGLPRAVRTVFVRLRSNCTQQPSPKLRTVPCALQAVRVGLEDADASQQLLESLVPMWEEERARGEGVLPERPASPPRSPGPLCAAVEAVRAEFRVGSAGARGAGLLRATFSTRAMGSAWSGDGHGATSTVSPSARRHNVTRRPSQAVHSSSNVLSLSLPVSPALQAIAQRHRELLLQRRRDAAAAAGGSPGAGGCGVATGGGAGPLAPTTQGTADLEPQPTPRAGLHVPLASQDAQDGAGEHAEALAGRGGADGGADGGAASQRGGAGAVVGGPAAGASQGAPQETPRATPPGPRLRGPGSQGPGGRRGGAGASQGAAGVGSAAAASPATRAELLLVSQVGLA